MLDEPAKLPLALWKPNFIGIMTFFILPGGWALGTINFYRLGHKRQVLNHLVFLLCLTLVIVGLAFFTGGRIPSASAFIIDVCLSLYIANANIKVINEYRAAGGVVQDTDEGMGILIGLAATAGWVLLCGILAMPVVLFQVFILGKSF